LQGSAQAKPQEVPQETPIDTKKFDVFTINDNKVILSKDPTEAAEAWDLLSTIVNKKYPRKE
jgi:hypothetical protein